MIAPRPLRRLLLAARLVTPAAALAAAEAATPAAAQVVSSTDIIIGRVTGAQNEPIENATVTATSVETGISRSKRTDANGRYTILFPDGGGQYRLTIASIGFAPRTINLARAADEDRLVANAQLGRNVQQLGTVTVRAQRERPGQRGDAGGTGAGLAPTLTNRLPVDATDLNALASLAPGVVAVAGTDSTAASFSVAGQPPSANNITLDGLTFGAGTVPSEAVRATRVITNTYDVARGQFTGGQVATTTRGGTNNLAGALNYSLRNRSLEFTEGSDAAFNQQYTQNQINAGVGGPIRKDKAFVYGAFQLNRRTDDLATILSATPATLGRLGVQPDSARRFIDVVQGYGLDAQLGDAPVIRVADNASAVVRADVNLTDEHSLTVRGDWRGQVQNGSRVQPLALPHLGAEGTSSGGGGMATLTSRVGQFINEARAYQSTDFRGADPYVTAPSGRVRVTSPDASGGKSIVTLQFGGNPSLPQSARTNAFQGSDELSWLSPGGAHRFKLGTLLDATHTRTNASSNRSGTFFFDSLGALDQLTPSSFTRTLSTRERTSGALDGAVYAGDSWRRSDALQLTYGVRLEGTRYLDAPATNPAVETAFGRNTNAFPSELHASPRLGFTYLLGAGENGPPSWVFRGGVGEFRARAPSNLFASAIDAAGFAGEQSQIVCVGAGVPTPNFADYLRDPTTIPSACLAGNPDVGTTPSQLGARRNVTVFDPAFVAPRAWRGSMGASRRFLQRYNLSVDASFARGLSQTGATDLNLRPDAAFTLATEGNRPVYVAPAAIIPTTGAIPLGPSRRDGAFGLVSEVNSRLHSSTSQLTAALQGFSTRGAIVNASYTISRVRDQTFGYGAGGFGGGGANTAGDPRQSSWAASDQERRHSLLGTVTFPIRPWVELTTIGRLYSGPRFSPLVSGDVNGDGSRNDRAFVFDPSRIASDSALANGMRRLLSDAPGRVRDCLEGQLGTVAGRNSCASPWQAALDFQANFRPTAFGLNRRLTLSVLAVNALAGFDQLFHGSDLRGWGQQTRPDQTLLYVKGFDAASQRYRYDVNGRFGTTSSSATAFRSPFQIGLQARMAIGPDPARQGVNAIFGGRGNGAGGRNGPPNADDFRARLARAVQNPFYRVLELKDSLALALTADQESRLKSLGDSLQTKADSLIASIAETLAKASANPDPASLATALRGRTSEARTLSEQAAKAAQQILTSEQWAKLPDNVKTPRRPGAGRGDFGGPGGEGGGRREGRPPID